MSLFMHSLTDFSNKHVFFYIEFAFFLLCLFIPAQLRAQLQEFQINPIAHEGPIPVFRDYPDLAAIFVQSSLTNLSFESNLEIIEERGDPTAGEYILLIEPVRQSIRVNAAGFMQARIQIQNLVERNVVYYSIEPVDGETIPVIIRIEPPDALVRVDGEPVDHSDTILLKPGIHSVAALLDGYRSIEQQIEVSQERTFFEFNMQRVEQQLIRVETDPAGATVFVGGVEIGETDRNGVIDFFRFPGQYVVSATKSGYRTKETTIRVAEQRKNNYTLQLERNAGFLVLQTNPPDARVTINRQPIDSSQPIELDPGLHRLEVSREGYEPFVENVTIERYEEIQRKVTLEPQTGTLLLTVSPSDATVVLFSEQGEKVDQWTGSRRITDLHVGNYQLRAEADRYQPYEENIQIEQNVASEKNIQLKERTTQVQETQISQSQNPKNGQRVNNDKLTIGIGASLYHYQRQFGYDFRFGFSLWKKFKSNLNVAYYPNNGLRDGTLESNTRYLNTSLNLRYYYLNNKYFKSYLEAGPGYRVTWFRTYECIDFGNCEDNYISKTEKKYSFEGNVSVGFEVNLNFAHIFFETRYHYRGRIQDAYGFTIISTGLQFKIL